MKKIFKLFWQLLLFPILYIPYSILNSIVIVKWLGCGCPQVAPDGNIINNFNANDFTLMFWEVVGTIVITISIFYTKHISRFYLKILYITVVAVCVVFLIISFVHSMMWR